MAYQLAGKIKTIGETVVVSEKFKKRDLVLTTDEGGNYPQQILVQLSNDKCDILNGYTVGQDVIVSINLKGREWTNPQGEVKVFNTIEGWKIDSMNGAAPQATNNLQENRTVVSPNTTMATDDDLPF